MSGTLKLPVGFENFETIRKEGFYYVDKTGLIKGLLEQNAYVTLFTRPRRFGKSLNMSMLKHFFGMGGDSTLFEGLEIARDRELCEKHMGKYPVISITLKGVDGRTFDSARAMLRMVVGNMAMRFDVLRQSEKLTEAERQQYAAFIGMSETGSFTMSDDLLQNSLKILSELLHKHFGQKTVLLIDEYDVPLDKAYQEGHYDDMVSLIRGFLGNALKTNEILIIKK